MSNMQPDGWNFSDLKYIELSKSEIENWRLDQGDILFNRTNSKELVGKCEVFDQEGDWVFASYLMRLTVDSHRAIPAFISAYLNSTSGRAQIARDSRQIIGMTNINAEEIRSLLVPLPDPDTQRNLLTALNAARKVRDQNLASVDATFGGLDKFILDALGLEIPSASDAMRPFAVRFGALRRDRIDADYHTPRFRQLRAAIEASRFDVQPVAELCLPLISGFAAGKADQTEDGEGLPHLRPTNISSRGEIIMAGTKYVPPADISKANLLAHGEVLFNNTNSALWVGKSAVFEMELSCACSNHITRLRLQDKRHKPEFLAALLNALRSVGYFSVLATNFNNQAGINADTLGSLRIPVAPPELQSSIANEVERRRAEAYRLRAKARADWERARSAFEAALLGPEP